MSIAGTGLASRGIPSPQGLSRFETATPAAPTNSQGIALPEVKSRGSRFYVNVVPAGGTLTVPMSGTQFYVTYATGIVTIRPSGGDFNDYESGTGLQLDLVNAFSQLDIKNNSANPIVFQLFIGFDGFIDNRLFLINGTQTVVAYPTYATPSSLTAVPINDISGTSFTDINGLEWYALQRQFFIVSNTDTGTTLLVQKAGASTSSGPAIAAVFPETSIRLDVAGDYALSLGGAPINALVSDYYVCIPKV